MSALPVSENANNTNKTGFVNEVWQAIAEFGSLLATNLRAINGMLVSLVWRGITWSANNIIFPVACTGVNILDYILDKVWFGSPILRQYLHDAIFPCEISNKWR